MKTYYKLVYLCIVFLPSILMVSCQHPLMPDSENQTSYTEQTQIWYNSRTKEQRKDSIPDIIPSYSTLAAVYNEVASLSNEEVYKKIGGKVYQNHINNPEQFSNSCVLRVSYALNGISVHNIKYERGNTISGDANRDGVLEWYYFRVIDLKYYLTNRYGSPIYAKNIADLRGKKGIIIFLDCDFGDTATGHASIWSGEYCLDEYYNASKCKSIYLWEAS